MVQSIYASDQDELEVAYRLSRTTWSRGSRNGRASPSERAPRRRVCSRGSQGDRPRALSESPGVLANATLYLSEHHPRQLPTYKKMREMFDKAWELSRPPFERVKVTVDGKTSRATSASLGARQEKGFRR